VTNATNDYFSYDIPVNGGTWHIIALDSECRTAVGGCQAGSAQETWLRNDLAAHPSTFTPRVLARATLVSDFPAGWRAAVRQ